MPVISGRLEEMLWRELGLLRGREFRPHYEMAVHGGWDFLEEGSPKIYYNDVSLLA